MEVPGVELHQKTRITQTVVEPIDSPVITEHRDPVSPGLDMRRHLNAIIDRLVRVAGKLADRKLHPIDPDGEVRVGYDDEPCRFNGLCQRKIADKIDVLIHPAASGKPDPPSVCGDGRFCGDSGCFYDFGFHRIC